MATGSNFPTTLDVFADKIDGVDDILAEETNTQSSAIEALQEKIGVNDSADTASLDFILQPLIDPSSATQDQVLLRDTVDPRGFKWADDPRGFHDPMTTRGDLITRNASNVTDRVGIGARGSILSSAGSDLAYVALGARGSILSSDGTDLAYVPIGTNGKVLQSNGTDFSWQTPSDPVPVGVISPFGGVVVPTGYLLCDGSAVSRATYANLFAALAVSKGTAVITSTMFNPFNAVLNAHGLITGDCISFSTGFSVVAGDTNYFVIKIDANNFAFADTYANALSGVKITGIGSSNNVGVIFNPYGISGASNFLVPDLRAATLRGAGTSTRFTQNQTINIGGAQSDQMQGHIHTTTADFVDAGAGNTADGEPGNIFTTGEISAPVTDGTNGTPRVGNETRMQNVGVQFIIKT